MGWVTYLQVTNVHPGSEVDTISILNMNAHFFHEYGSIQTAAYPLV